MGLKASITEGGKEGKSKAITSCNYLEERFQQCSKREGVVLARSVETLGVDPRTRIKLFGAKEKGEKKLVRCEILCYQANFVLPSIKTVGVRKALTTGSVPARTWRLQKG